MKIEIFYMNYIIMHIFFNYLFLLTVTRKYHPKAHLRLSE